MTKNEIKNSYVKNTGKAIVDTFSKRGINVNEIPAILVRGHAPFTMGINAEKAFENLIVLEEVAEMYFKTIALENKIKFDPYLLIKHFERKNGKNIMVKNNLKKLDYFVNLHLNLFRSFFFIRLKIVRKKFFTLIHQILILTKAAAMKPKIA